MTPLRSSICLLVFMVCLTFAQPFAALAQTNASAPLPAAAQEAVNKGITAAKLPDYPLAIRYFEDARKIAPDAPVIYLNLGLAESKMSGRELRAMAWFGAYLAAYPDAPNAAAVKEKIGEMDVRIQSNFSRLLKVVEEAADQSPDRDKTSGINWGGNRGGSLHRAACLWAISGDSTAALRTVSRIKGPKSEAQLFVGDHLLKFGDKAGARKAFDLAIQTAKQETGDPSWTQMEVAKFQAANGEIADAIQTAKLIDIIKHPRENAHAKCAIAAAQLKAGDRLGARQTLATAIQTAERVKDEANFPIKSWIQEEIVLVQVDAGDLDAAQLTAAQIQEDSKKKWAQGFIDKAKILAQAESGDTAGALQAADRISKALVAIIQAKVGDIASAQKTMESISDDRDAAKRAIAMAQAKAGDFVGAQKTVDEISDYIRSEAQTDIDKAQAQAHVGPSPIPTKMWVAKNEGLLNKPVFLDYAGALKERGNGSPKETFPALRDMALEIHNSRHAITQMLKGKIP